MAFEFSEIADKQRALGDNVPCHPFRPRTLERGVQKGPHCLAISHLGKRFVRRDEQVALEILSVRKAQPMKSTDVLRMLANKFFHEESSFFALRRLFVCSSPKGRCMAYQLSSLCDAAITLTANAPHSFA